MQMTSKIYFFYFLVFTLHLNFIHRNDPFGIWSPIPKMRIWDLSSLVSISIWGFWKIIKTQWYFAIWTLGLVHWRSNFWKTREFWCVTWFSTLMYTSMVNFLDYSSIFYIKYDFFSTFLQKFMVISNFQKLDLIFEKYIEILNSYFVANW